MQVAHLEHVHMRHATHVQCMCACTHGCMCRVGPLTHTTISGRPSAAATDAADANARSRFPSPFFTLTITHLRESSCTGVGERGRSGRLWSARGLSKREGGAVICGHSGRGGAYFLRLLLRSSSAWRG